MNNLLITLGSSHIKKTNIIYHFPYLLLHLHIFEDGVHPPRLGEHGSKSCGVSNNENPRPNLSEDQEHT